MSRKRLIVSAVVVLALAVVCAAVLFPCFGGARAKARRGSGTPAMVNRMPGSEGADDEALYARGDAMYGGSGPGTGGLLPGGAKMAFESEAPGDARDAVSVAPEPRLDRDAYVSSSYLTGSGQRERLAKLVEEGVMVDGKRVKLEAFASQYSQPFRIPTKAALSLEADTERAKLLTKGGKTYLQVGIQAIDREAPQRPKLNLCLVIDRSGSMSGE